MARRDNSGRRPLRRAAGVSAVGAVGAFVTFGMAPVAQVDDVGLDALVNAVIDSFSGALPAAEVGGLDISGALNAAAFPPPQPADNFFLDLVNMPSVLLFGRELMGNGFSVGWTLPAIWGGWHLGGGKPLADRWLAAAAVRQPR